MACLHGYQIVIDGDFAIYRYRSASISEGKKLIERCREKPLIISAANGKALEKIAEQKGSQMVVAYAEQH
jgi:hypothetical protein